MGGGFLSLAQARYPALIDGIIFSALVTVLLSYVLLLTLDPTAARALTSEDALIEHLGAAFLLVAVVLFMFCYFASEEGTNRLLGLETTRNTWFLALALLMLVCLGEEISWGQRIIGWGTPELFNSLNAQRETNLHNLWLFQASNPDGTKKSGLELLLNSNRLLSIFWLSYCVLVPLLVRASDKARRLAKFFGFPVPLLVTGSMFVVNFAVFRLIVVFGGLDQDTISALDELKETNYEFAFMVLALCFLLESAGGLTRRIAQH